MSDAEQTEKQAEQQPEQQQQQQLDAPQQQHEQPTPQQQEQQQQPEPAQQQNQPSTEQPQPQQPQQQEQQQVAAKPPKSGKQRNLRKKRALEDDPEDAATAADEAAAAEVKADLLHGLKLLQKQRKRTAGIDASKLVPAAADDGDGFGDNELMDAQYVKAEGTAKSQILDEETHMQRYIESQLAARLGKQVDEGQQRLSRQQQEELELYRLPEGLQASLTQEVSLPGMMTAITEVEVSKESKMAQIEATEAVKAALLAKKAGGGDKAAADGDADDGTGLRRGMFAFSFGKQQKPRQYQGLDPSQLEEQRKYITERSRDPKDVARLRQQKRGGR